MRLSRERMNMDESVFLEALNKKWSMVTLAAWADWLNDEGRMHRSAAVRYLLKYKWKPAREEERVFNGRFFVYYPTTEGLPICNRESMCVFPKYNGNWVYSPAAAVLPIVNFLEELVAQTEELHK